MVTLPPILLLRTIANRQLVAQCCQRCAQAGVRREMTLAHARALLASTAATLHETEIDPLRDANALHALARWCLRFTPWVAVDPPNGLLLDIAGCDHLFGGEARMLRIIAGAMRRFGLHARLAAADTIGGAWAVARFAAEPRPRIESGDERDALAALPVEGLRLDADVVESLHEVNIDRIGHLYPLLRSELAARFGTDLLHRLDQALGGAWETIEPIRSLEPVAVDRSFEGPVKNLEAICLAVRDLIETCAAQLARRNSGVRELEVIFARIDATPVCERFYLSRPSRNVKHLWSMLRPRVERVHLGFGVECITMTATRVGRLRHRQTRCWPGDAGTGDDGDGRSSDRVLAEFIDTAASRCGIDGVQRMEILESHLPERVHRFRSAVRDEHEERPRRAKTRSAARLSRSNRPSHLLEPPEPVQVIALAPDGPISQLRWRERTHELVACFGPERISPEWWTAETSGVPHVRPAGVRDYFRVQTATGQWLWVYRAANRAGWFLHGWWA